MNLTNQLLASPPKMISHVRARAAWTEYRGRPGVKLLTPPDANTKFRKTSTPVYGLSLLPAKASNHEVCNYRTPACTAGCVAYAGRGKSPKVLAGRAHKTEFFARNPDAFTSLLYWEIAAAEDRHYPQKIAVRLNAFSDIPWESVAPWLFDTAPEIQFYDYTKWPHQRRESRLPHNYDLTYSVDDSWTENRIALNLRQGFRLAMIVPSGQEITPMFHNYPCVNGDLSDARWEDPKPGLVLLKAKGDMRKGNPMVHNMLEFG